MNELLFLWAKTLINREKIVDITRSAMGAFSWVEYQWISLLFKKS